MRGKGRRVEKNKNGGRITPAYAGKSSNTQHNFFPRWDHPRLCGEKPRTSNSKLVTVGSPPPMRGKVLRKANGKPHRGITPAYAGKSYTLQRSFGRLRDHPRLCGEKDLLKKIGLIEIGSPPPMRGKEKRSNALGNWL